MTSIPWIVRVVGTENQYAAIEPNTAEELRRRKLIWFDNGDWWILDGHDAVIVSNPDIAICDFCGEKPVAWIAKAHAFRIGERGPFPGGIVGTHESPDDWTACDECGRLIAAGNRDGLLDRAVSTLAPKYGIPTAFARDYIGDTQAKFWKAFRILQRFVQ